MQRHHFAFIVATVATLGSLYFSEVMLYLPLQAVLVSAHIHVPARDLLLDYHVNEP